jgi:16S rRNA (adenine1518-N6/adenine1519-N6)-dimethyltransferase
MQRNGYQVVANIPYYITSAIIRHLLEADVKPSRLVLTIQKEVAQRICAPAGDLSLLALSVQVYGDPNIVAKIPAGAFYPPPTVDSAVIRVDLFPQPIIPVEQLETFFKLAKAGFGQKRKMLRKSLSGGLPIDSKQAAELLTACDIDPTRRAETLTLYEWKILTRAYLDMGF